MSIAGIGDPDAGNMIRPMPGPPINDQTGRTGSDTQRHRIFTVGGNGADPMFGSAPGHHLQQPRSWPNLRKIRKFGVRNGGGIDDAFFKAKGNAAGKMRAGEFQNRGIGRKGHGCAVFFPCRAQMSLVETITVNETERLHLPFNVMDLQHGRLRMGLANESAETPASFNQARCTSSPRALFTVMREQAYCRVISCSKGIR